MTDEHRRYSLSVEVVIRDDTNNSEVMSNLRKYSNLKYGDVNRLEEILAGVDDQLITMAKEQEDDMGKASVGGKKG